MGSQGKKNALSYGDMDHLFNQMNRTVTIRVIHLQDEVNKLIIVTLGEREREIIRLYYGLDKECLTWEDISKR